MSVGVAVLDEDHKKLVSLINDLEHGISVGQGTERLGRVLNGLIGYVGTHFAHEEEFFTQTDYPDAEEHIREHHDFSEKIHAIQERYNGGHFDALSQSTLELAKNWLHNHVMDMDKKYEAHMHSNGIR